MDLACESSNFSPVISIFKGIKSMTWRCGLIALLAKDNHRCLLWLAFILALIIVWIWFLEWLHTMLILLQKLRMAPLSCFICKVGFNSKLGLRSILLIISLTGITRLSIWRMIQTLESSCRFWKLRGFLLVNWVIWL